MRWNNSLRLHVINVGHGDAILVEFPDSRIPGPRKPWFGLVDAGGEDAEVRTKTADYIETFLDYRFEGAPRSTAAADPDAEDYIFEFICLTHPHRDHLYGMMDVLERHCSDQIPRNMRPRQFWDCGFRYNTAGYLEILEFLSRHQGVTFMRVTSGTEFHFEELEVVALAPSVDMRNRYETYGVDLNDASIILRLTLGRGVAILTGDAHFDTWGKVCEEFPRTRHMVYEEDSQGRPDLRSSDRDDIAFLNRSNQLNCTFLKVSHHGSKRGTSYEYVEKLSPSHVAITCDLNAEYAGNWRHKFPHPITRLILGEELDRFEADDTAIPSVAALGGRVGTTADHGTMVYRINRGAQVGRAELNDAKATRVATATLVSEL